MRTTVLLAIGAVIIGGAIAHLGFATRGAFDEPAITAIEERQRSNVARTAARESPPSMSGAEVAPWDATPEASTALPAGYVPPWDVKLSPHPASPPPPSPTPPLDPAQHRPSMTAPIDAERRRL